MKTSAGWMLALAATLCAAGCVTPPPSTFCAEARRLYLAPPSPEWLLDHDPELAAEILAHNEHGARSCGWPAPRP